MFIFLTILGLSLLILVHELGHFLAAKFFGLRVDEFGFGLPPRAWGKKIGETIYSLNWLPFGGFVKIYGEDTAGETSFMRTSDAPEVRPQGPPRSDLTILAPERSFSTAVPWKKSLIILAGVFMNFLLGWFLISTGFILGTPDGVIITEVSPGSPAAEAGLMAGDKILRVDIPILDPNQFIKFINENAGEELVITVTPRLTPLEGEGALGVALTGGGGKLGPFEAVTQGFLVTVNLIVLILVTFGTLIAGIFTGTADLTGVVGPIGIFGVAASTGALGFVYFMNLFALISINLGVINVIPFPALDGGRFLFILIEKLKGSPIPVTFERAVNGIGFAILILLMVLITIRDVQNIL